MPPILAVIVLIVTVFSADGVKVAAAVAPDQDTCLATAQQLMASAPDGTVVQAACFRVARAPEQSS